jgi:hypothetical protein
LANFNRIGCPYYKLQSPSSLFNKLPLRQFSQVPKVQSALVHSAPSSLSNLLSGRCLQFKGKGILPWSSFLGNSWDWDLWARRISECLIGCCVRGSSFNWNFSWHRYLCYREFHGVAFRLHFIKLIDINSRNPRDQFVTFIAKDLAFYFQFAPCQLLINFIWAQWI